MSFSKILAALAALKEFKETQLRLKALEVFEFSISQDSSVPKASPSACISDDILDTCLAQIERTANRYGSALTVEQTHSQLLKEGDILLSNLNYWLKTIKGLNGGVAPMQQLYELEVAAHELTS